jgi:hypothetical protein
MIQYLKQHLLKNEVINFVEIKNNLKNLKNLLKFLVNS